MKHKLSVSSCAILFALLLCALQAMQGQTLVYPTAPKGNVVDTLFGTAVPDPYRWMENDTSAALAQWVAAENALTNGFLEKIPFRSALKTRLTHLMDYPRFTPPERHKQFYLFAKNDGLQEQSVLYIQRGLTGKPEVLLDPNKLSADGTTRLTLTSVSRDARYLAYGISQSGSDWMELRVMEIADRKILPDRLRWVKVSDAAWKDSGFYYSRFDAPRDSAGALTHENENHRVYYHVIGTSQAEDELVFADPPHPRRFHTVETTEDERFLFLTVSDRSEGKDGNALYFRDLQRGDKTFTPIIMGFDARFELLANIGDQFLILTNWQAPNRRVVLVDAAKTEEDHWRTILPEQKEPLTSVLYAGGRLVATSLKDVASRACVYDLNGTLEHEIQLPTLGTVNNLTGRPNDPRVFFSFYSFTYPPTTYLYDLLEDTLAVYRASTATFSPGDYLTRQVFFQSKDGTRIPMFVVHKKTLLPDGKTPTLLYGYGGFNISLLPTFNPRLIAWLEQGGIYAVANIRGGGEYGGKWYNAAIKEKKQNCFDDFIAAAEWLISHHFTTGEHLAIQGSSNGGLLVGAVVNQRPDLFHVALPDVGVMDMLRFHKFTIGWNWTPDYGSSEDSLGFRALYAYSPLHNIRHGVTYPAMLITTADHDDRVVPAHSFKYTATLQEKAAGASPFLIRIETRSGHGASSTTKAIETTTDQYAFLFTLLGMTPSFDSPGVQ